MRVFILQAHSIARAHVSAMGGNALLSYKMNKCALIEHCQQNKVNHLRYKAQVCTHTHMYMCMYMRSTAFVQGGANSNVTAWFEMAYIYVVQCKWFTTLATGQFLHFLLCQVFIFHTLFA